MNRNVEILPKRSCYLQVPALVASDLVVGVDSGTGTGTRLIQIGTAWARQVEVLATIVICAPRVTRMTRVRTCPRIKDAYVTHK